MSVEALVWALNVPIGSTPKIILLGLANHASAEFTEARPAVATLATYAHCSDRTVQRVLRDLEAAGWIEKTGEHPVAGRADRAVYVYRLARGDRDVTPHGATSGDGVTSATERGDIQGTNGVTPMSPEPSLEPSKGKPSKLRAARTSDDWPEKLQDTAAAQEVLDTLIEVAHEHGAPPPTRKAVGHALLAFPDKGHLVEARLMASWFANRQIKRVVPTYSNWLGNADPANTRNGLRSVKAAPAQKLEAKSKSERQTLQEWAAENVPDLPVSRVMSAATRLQYAGHEVTANRVRAYLEQATS